MTRTITTHATTVETACGGHRFAFCEAATCDWQAPLRRLRVLAWADGARHARRALREAQARCMGCQMDKIGAVHQHDCASRSARQH